MTAHCPHCGLPTEPSPCTGITMRFDDAALRVTIGEDGHVHLTETEYRLLRFIYQYNGAATDLLERSVWPKDTGHGISVENRRKVTISNIRKKLEPTGATIRHVKRLVYAIEPLNPDLSK